MYWETVHKEFITVHRTKIMEVFYLFYSCLTVFYQEIIFHISIKEPVIEGNWIFFALFSLVYGLLLYLLGTISRNQTLNKVIRSILLFLAAIPFLVWYFIYAKFRILYDVSTAFSGATDAVSGFSGDILRLVFSVNGILHIGLCLLPFILYVCLGRKFDSAEGIRAKGRLLVIGIGFLSWSAGFLGLRFYPALENVYTGEYHFENAVSNFGLYTGVQLDILHYGKSGKLSGGGLVIPTAVPAAPLETEWTEAEGTDRNSGTEPVDAEIAGTESEELIVDTSPNVLEIDFDALATNASAELIEVDEYVRALTPTNKNVYTGMFKGKNLIFITAEAFTAEVIDPRLTPTLYRLATKGIQVADYYQPDIAGTTGGEYANLMGMLPTSGGNSMKIAAGNHNYMTIGRLLSEEGYCGKAFHNNSCTFYSRHKTHINLGYSDGFMGYGNGMEEFVENCWPQSDLEMMRGTLPEYIGRQPFNLYYMSVSGHSNYEWNENAMARRHREEVEHLTCSDPVKVYLAAQLELEAALAYVVEELEKAGIADDTVICISSDHCPYGLDENESSGTYRYLSELYGCEVDNVFVRDHNRLIIWSGCLEKDPPIVVTSPVFSPDILPTLCNLFGIAYDSRLLPGRDILSDSQALVYDLSYNWKTDLGIYLAAKGKFIPANEEAVIPEGYIECIQQIVRNKINYSKKVLALDYYRHIFPEKE